jgi:hypothetical protein
MASNDGFNFVGLPPGDNPLIRAQSPGYSGDTRECEMTPDVDTDENNSVPRNKKC